MAKKILVIDDDLVGIALMQSRLSKAGYDVVVARNGQVGFERLLKEKPSLVVLDIEMPEMNGYTFIVEMKKDAGASATPVIVLTAHEENRAIFARRGIVNYLVKPVNFDVLFAKITDLVGS